MSDSAISDGSGEERNRTASAFQIIGAPRWRTISAIGMIALWLLFFYSFMGFGPHGSNASRSRPCVLPMLPIFWLPGYLWTLYNRRRKIRMHPLVRSGHAKTAGYTSPKEWSRKNQGLLLLTGDELVFVPRSAGRDAGLEQRIPLAGIDAVENPRILALPMESIGIHSGGTIRRFRVQAPGQWIRAIGEARLKAQKTGQ